MKQVGWMAAGCLGSWIIATALLGTRTEILLGMIGPLVAAAGTWLAIEGTARRDPARVTRVLMAAFGLKLLFFGAYVVGISRVPGIDLATFAVAFFVYFVVLYIVQAFLVRGLTAPRPS